MKLRKPTELKLLLITLLLIVNKIYADEKDNITPHSKYDIIQWSAEQCKHGQNQSPIDIKFIKCERKFFSDFKWSENFDRKIEMRLTHDGYRLMLFPQRRITVRGGPFADDNKLESIRFIYPSEHTIQEKYYPLEIHMNFFEESNVDINKAYEMRSVTIVAVMCDIKAGDSGMILRDITEKVHLIQNEVIGNLTIQMTLSRFFTNLESYFVYKGSSTDAWQDCVEGVQWVVFADILPITSKDIFRLKKTTYDGIHALDAINRDLKLLMNRTIFYSSANSNNDLSIILIFLLMVIILLYYQINK